MSAVLSGPLKGPLLGLTAFAVFSLHDAFIKSIQGVSVFQIAFFVVLFSFVPFAFFLALDNHKRSLRPRLPGLVALRCLFSLGSLLCVFYAFGVLPMTQVYALIFASPILITLLAIPVLGEKIKMVRWIAIVVGLCGVLIILRPGQAPITLGHMAALIAACCIACSAVVTRKIGSREDSLTLILYPMLVNFIVTGGCMIYFYQPLSGVTLATLAGIGLLSVVGQSLLIQAYRLSEAQFIAPMQYSQMLWAVIYGALVFGEPTDRYVVVGSCVVIFSGLLFVWREVVASVTKPILRTRNLRSVAGPQLISSESDKESRDSDFSGKDTDRKAP